MVTRALGVLARSRPVPRIEPARPSGRRLARPSRRSRARPSPPRPSYRPVPAPEPCHLFMITEVCQQVLPRELRDHEFTALFLPRTAVPPGGPATYHYLVQR